MVYGLKPQHINHRHEHQQPSPSKEYKNPNTAAATCSRLLRLSIWERQKKGLSSRLTSIAAKTLMQQQRHGTWRQILHPVWQLAEQDASLRTASTGSMSS